jgi:hypothetical protein
MARLWHGCKLNTIAAAITNHFHPNRFGQKTHLQTTRRFAMLTRELAVGAGGPGVPDLTHGASVVVIDVC